MSKKTTSLVVWMDPRDCDPPHEVRKHERLEPLVYAFATEGFDKSRPALVGYILNGRIQLLSGTHRHAAAKKVGIQIPVTIWLGSQIEESWGVSLEEWRRIMEDIPVSDLETVDLEYFREHGLVEK